MTEPQEIAMEPEKARLGFSEMTTMKKVYFISAWVVAGAAALALILTAIGWGGALGFGGLCEAAFIGITGCFLLLYLSDWFKNRLVLFILAWVVAGLAVLALILESIGFAPAWFIGATILVGTIFRIIALGTFCTLLMLHLSGQFTKAE